MYKWNAKKTTALLLALLILALASGCGSRTEVQVSEEESQEEEVFQDVDFMNPLQLSLGSVELSADTAYLQPYIEEKDAVNDHTVGWLQLTSTAVDDVVVQHPGDTNNRDAFYLRRDFNGNYLFDGTYFVDYRANIDGTREGLSKNTVIYGHSYTDNTTGKVLDQMKKYRVDEDFARENPYIYFSLEGEDVAWEVVAVFDATINFNYNNPNPTDEEFAAVLEEARKLSYYNYDVEVREDDKFLTISTCTYNYVSSYPNDYRFVVLARMVNPGENTKTTASLTANENRKTPV